MEKKIAISQKIFYLTIANSINQILAIILVMVLSRFLTKDLFGTYKQITLIYEIIAPLFIGGLPASLLYFFPQLEKSQKKKILAQTIFLLVIGGSILSLFLLISSGFLAKYFNNYNLKTLLIIYSVVPLFSIVSSFFNSLLVAENRNKFLAIYIIITTLIYCLGLVFLVAYFKDLKPMVLFMVFYNLVIAFFNLYYTHSKLVKFKISDFAIDKKILKKQISYSLPLGIASWVGQFGYQIDRLLVSYFFNPSVLANYTVGAFEVPFLRTFSGTVGTILIPEFSTFIKEKNFNKVIKLWQKSIHLVSLLFFPAFFYLEIMAFFIIKFFFSEKYIDSVTIFRIYQIFILIRIPSFSSIFQGSGESKIVFRGTLVFIITNLIFSLLLLKFFGVLGPAIGTIIAGIAAAFYYFYYLKKNFQFFNFKNIISWEDIFWNFICSVLASIPLFLYLKYFVFYTNNTILILFLTGISYLFFYFLMLKVFKRIHPEDKEVFKKIIKLPNFKIGFLKSFLEKK